MKIVYLGSGEFGIDCLDAIAGSGHNLELVVTGPPQPAGRGRKSRPTAVARWANQRAGTTAFVEAEDVNTVDFIEKIVIYEPELIVVVAFGQKIGNQLIELPTTAAINVHASLLPKYRGAAPVNWVVINGERQTGITIIALAEKMDAGDVLARKATDIRAGETAGQLHDRLAKMAPPLLLETIDKIADGTVEYKPQDHSKATLAPKLKKSDGILDFNEPAEALARKILGFWPWPGASAYYFSKKTGKQLRVIIAMAEVVETSNPHALPPGTLDEKLNVICGKDALKITKIKPAGSSLMDYADFVNGWHTQLGDIFMEIKK
jgi:methionyl-tRNA formyltransferase